MPQNNSGLNLNPQITRERIKSLVLNKKNLAENKILNLKKKICWFERIREFLYLSFFVFSLMKKSWNHIKLTFTMKLEMS